jgi:hypothetical protein
LTLWVIDRFLEIVRHVLNGVSAALTAVGEMLSVASWWQVLVAAVGGLIVGGVACGIARALGAPIGVAASIGVAVGVSAFVGFLSLLLD